MAQDLAKVNNLLQEATHPVIPFAWKQPVAASIKIQVEDQNLNEASNPVGQESSALFVCHIMDLATFYSASLILQ